MRRKTLPLALAATTGAKTAVALTVIREVSVATPDVPLDCRDPDRRQIEIAISRPRSKNPPQRRGVLLANPGGPGITGLGYAAVLAAAKLPQKVLDSYDVIGFDPRGADRSTSVNCGLTKEQQNRGNFPP